MKPRPPLYRCIACDEVKTRRQNARCSSCLAIGALTPRQKLAAEQRFAVAVEREERKLERKETLASHELSVRAQREARRHRQAEAFRIARERIEMHRERATTAENRRVSRPPTITPMEAAAQIVERESGISRQRWWYATPNSDPAMIRLNERHAVLMRQLAGVPHGTVPTPAIPLTGAEKAL